MRRTSDLWMVRGPARVCVCVCEQMIGVTMYYEIRLCSVFLFVCFCLFYLFVCFACEIVVVQLISRLTLWYISENVTEIHGLAKVSQTNDTVIYL